MKNANDRVFHGLLFLGGQEDGKGIGEKILHI